MSIIRKTAVVLALGVAAATSVSAQELTITTANNSHIINMQKVSEVYTADTGVSINWVSLEEGMLREQVSSDEATGGGEYDIVNIGMQEAPTALTWGAVGWAEPLEFGEANNVDDMLPAMRYGVSHEGSLYAAPVYGESSTVMYRKEFQEAAAFAAEMATIDSAVPEADLKPYVGVQLAAVQAIGIAPAVKFSVGGFPIGINTDFQDKVADPAVAAATDFGIPDPSNLDLEELKIGAVYKPVISGLIKSLDAAATDFGIPDPSNSDLEELRLDSASAGGFLFDLQVEG